MPRIGLALAGGGPLGAIWEVGALCALAEALPGVDFVGLDGYVGVHPSDEKRIRRLLGER